MRTYRYTDDASKARNMVLFAQLQRATQQPITAQVLAHLLKMHRQFKQNFDKNNAKRDAAWLFFKNFERDYGSPRNTDDPASHEYMWRVEIEERVPSVRWVRGKSQPVEFPS